MTEQASAGRILLLTKTDFTEPRDGGTLRVSAIARVLSERGYSVQAMAVRTAVGERYGASATAAQLHPLAALRAAAACARIGSLSVARWFSLDLAQRIADSRLRRRYDLAIVEYSQMLLYRPLLGDLPVLLDMHNVEHELMRNYAASVTSRPRRLLARYEAGRLRRLESQRFFRPTDAVVTVSERDGQMVRHLLGGASELVRSAPNGVSDAAFTTARASAPSTTVVFVAHLGWQPNVDAVHWLAGQVWPRVVARVPTARLQLIGRSPAKSVLRFGSQPGISVHADVASTLPYLASAAVATAPLLAAGGTRLKILEALATGTPVVATALGAMGLEHLADGPGVVIADAVEEFADALVRMMNAPPPPDAVREQVEQYRWDRALAPLVAAVEEIRRPARAGRA